MRIVQIIDILYYGGAQTMQIMFARSMRNFPDINITVVSLRDNVHNTPIPDQLKSLGVNVVFCSARKLWNPQRFWRLMKFLREEKFDVVHTHLPYSNILGAIAGRLAGIPVIASIRNSRDDDWGRYYFVRNGIETIVLRYIANKVMAVGYSTAAVHQKRMGKKQIQAVPNALEIIPLPTKEERSHIRNELVGDSKHPILISVGRLVEQKGYDDLLDAFALVLQKHPSIFLLIVGAGPLFDHLNGKIDELGLIKNAFLLGSRDDVSRLLVASDIFVNSSHWEGLSVAILEAMAAGLPVVATNVSDSPSIVKKGTGLVVSPKAPTELANAIGLLLDNPEICLAYGKAARSYIRQNHSPHEWADKIVSLYKSI